MLELAECCHMKQCGPRIHTLEPGGNAAKHPQHTKPHFKEPKYEYRMAGACAPTKTPTQPPSNAYKHAHSAKAVPP